MKRIRTWVMVIAFLIILVDWGVMVLKLYDGIYNITAEAYIAMACLIVILVCAISKMFSDKCPQWLSKRKRWRFFHLPALVVCSIFNACQPGKSEFNDACIDWLLSIVQR